MTEELENGLLELIRTEPDQGRRTVLMLMYKQQEVVQGYVTALNDHIEESKGLRAIILELGSAEEVKGRREMIDRIIDRETRRVQFYEKFLGKFAEAAASQIGRHTPRLLVALGVIAWIGWEKVFTLLRGL